MGPCSDAQNAAEFNGRILPLIDVMFSAELMLNGVPKSMVITIRALEGESFKSHRCAVGLRSGAARGGRVCPVKAMWAWKKITIRTYGYLDPDVFSYTVDNVRKAFQRVAAESPGGTPQAYGLHLLRAGAATDAKELGWSVSEIMFMGRWQSPTVLVYLRQGARWMHQLGLPMRSGTTTRPAMFRE
jgi:hypothetical protein